MKKGYIFSAILGGTFFAVPYLALGVKLVPSLAISAVAYGAGTLIFKDRSKIDYSTKNTNLYEILKNTKTVGTAFLPNFLAKGRELENLFFYVYL